MVKIFGIALVMIMHLAAFSQTRTNEEIIRAYFEGFEKKNWSLVEAQLADGFTFTSPAPDDHISAQQFKDKCWTQAPHIRKFEFIRMYGHDAETFVLVHVVTDTGAIIRNVEFFTFGNGKIKSIEVFFGGNGQGFPTNGK